MVDETVDVVDDLQIVRLAVHFGQRVEAFDGGAVGGIGFQAGALVAPVTMVACWLLRLVKKEMDFSFASFDRVTHLSRPAIWRRFVTSSSETLSNGEVGSPAGMFFPYFYCREEGGAELSKYWTLLSKIWTDGGGCCLIIALLFNRLYVMA